MSLPYAESFRDLLVYQKAKALSKEIFQKQASTLIKQCEEIGRLLGGMIAKSEKFCSKPPHVIRKEAAEYFARDQSGE